jgi:TetR/AcrR family transcriptional repressor of nem operon
MPRDTERRILDVAESLIQARGHNAFSFQDIALRLKIRTASIHYHFPAKQDLVRAVLVRYRLAFKAALIKLDAETHSPRRKVERLIQLFQRVSTGGGDENICIGGMLACEYGTLPGPVRDELRQFFEDIESWLTNVLERGRGRRGDAGLRPSPASLASTLCAGLEGAAIVTRVFGNDDHFATISRCLLSLVSDESA